MDTGCVVTGLEVAGWEEKDYQSQRRKKGSRGSGIGRPEIKICVEMGDELGNT